jgi:hypothetical protein
LKNLTAADKYLTAAVKLFEILLLLDFSYTEKLIFWVWVAGRGLKFGMNMRCLLLIKNKYSNLQVF